ncbi:MAG: DUF4230 domain-containing protein [Acidimicrobiia bacterium]|nr:DUF4230 domain-containing protein [Acidimicrobiia bacterium]
MLDLLTKRLTSLIVAVLVAAIVAIGIVVGLSRAGSAVAERLPDMPGFPNVPSPAEVVEAVVEKEPYEEIGPAVVDSIQALADLTTVEYVEYTTISKGTDGSWLDWARGDSIEMLAIAEIGAGVDLAELDAGSFSVDTQNGIVTFQLPGAEIHYSALDNDATRVYDRKTGLFTHGDPQLETEARQAAEDALLQKALDEGILEDAEANATKLLTELLESLGYQEVVVVPPDRTPAAVSP